LKKQLAAGLMGLNESDDSLKAAEQKAKEAEQKAKEAMKIFEEHQELTENTEEAAKEAFRCADKMKADFIKFLNKVSSEEPRAKRYESDKLKEAYKKLEEAEEAEKALKAKHEAELKAMHEAEQPLLLPIEEGMKAMSSHEQTGNFHPHRTSTVSKQSIAAASAQWRAMSAPPMANQGRSGQSGP